MNHYVSHLEAAIDGTALPFGTLANMHNGRPIWVRYHLDKVRAAVTSDEIAKRLPSLWRYRELLPLPRDAEPVTLGEGMTPLLHCPRLGRQLGLSQLYVKDESQLPTGSFKSRGMAAAISMAKWLGVKRVALPTAGNAGGAAAAYAARAGIECFVFMPHDTPSVNQFEAQLYGAKAFRVNGLINDCGKIVKDGAERMGWFDLSTLKEPYRLEGKKTMGLELAEQFGRGLQGEPTGGSPSPAARGLQREPANGSPSPGSWQLPDVIFYPTGGGTGLVGMWKAFAELAELGWLRATPGHASGIRFPRLISCQAEGCAPIVTAYQKGERFAELFPNARTVASGLRVPVAVGDFMILDAIRASGGTAVLGRESEIARWMQRASSAEGISICPETAVCFDALERMVAAGEVKPDERVVVFNTGAAPKYLEAMPYDLPSLDKDALDWDRIAG
ncbi:Threonine synthase [Gemmata obscuriglobus]|uniref:Threonine synthase n=1 Tax=Gemmata obscuriglobus TaxID=114 RepID=A0A2Z3GYR0_9BACT|nr:threonine synthase [Gemmata obscuriglobus]AWM36627.1 threonine synthase [Gemmata obscuriglobus]QEG30736.1 Threonine synthase [Gemmata obscuriglobus]VTS10066.1 threonine synthase : Threonine synthase OS=Candidatus Entotheonella sp. TSY1 GN=ETSY1_27390 PE=4 SV=1: PALP [Gemmata obscuriglobus UQM 2246]